MKTERRERLEIVLSKHEFRYLYSHNHDSYMMGIINTITDALIKCEMDYTYVRDELEALKGEDDDLGYDLDYVQQGGSFIP